MMAVWRTGRLCFGRMHEDWAIEARAFAGRRRIFCIASAGCTALALAARGHEVHAVDVNPAQVAYVRARLAGEPPRDGLAERFVGLARRLAPVLGLTADLVDRFLRMDDPAAQAAFWTASLGTSRRSLLLDRLRRGTARHPNATNPYLWWLLRGTVPPGANPAPVGAPAALEVADAADYLLAGPAARFDGFSLSNILDAGADRARLAAGLRHAARPGAVAVLRTFRQPRDDTSAALAAEDRSMLWGAITLQSFA